MNSSSRTITDLIILMEEIWQKIPVLTINNISFTSICEVFNKLAMSFPPRLWRHQLAYTVYIFCGRWQLIHTIERQLLSEHLTGILSKGLEALMDGPRTQDLTTLYSLFSRVKDGLNELCSHFNAYIKVTCL